MTIQTPTGPFWPWYLRTTQAPTLAAFVAWIGARWREWEALNGRARGEFGGADVPSFKKYLDATVNQEDEGA